jgi:hypothetical protein
MCHSALPAASPRDARWIGANAKGSQVGERQALAGNGCARAIGRITTTGSVTNYTDASISEPQAIVAGPDGALWFTDRTVKGIGRITTAGVVTKFSGSGSYGLAVGSDGALWFANYQYRQYSIGRITTSGVVTNYAGPDGALWFTSEDNLSIGRITTAGVVTKYKQPDLFDPWQITPGPDGAMWFTIDAGSGINEIGRITTPTYARVSPAAGPVRTPAVISGGGFTPGETVKVTYATGMPAPLTTVALCSATVTTDSRFSCAGRIPPSTRAGAAGLHTIVAKGLTSHATASTAFTLN